MDLDRYFQRIGFRGAARAEFKTFKALHRAHVEALTYENLDVQFGRPVTRDDAAIFDKIVRGGRGGWCYEMNGLLASALDAIGFDVTRLAGAVMRDQVGDVMIGNHLVLHVRVDGEDWIGDAGFGDGMIDPAPLREGPTGANPFDCRFERLDGGWWRYRNDPAMGGPNFDFNLAVTDEALLESNCRRLQTDPQSPFVQNAVVQRWKDGAHWSLRGRVLRKLTPGGESRSLVASAGDYVRTLKETFDLDLKAAERLWPSICERHEMLFAGKDPLAPAPALSADEIRAALSRPASLNS